MTKTQHTEVAIKDILKIALALHQNGKYIEAGKLYDRILATYPNHFDALHLLGVISAQKKNFLDSVYLISKAIHIRNNVHTAYANRGNAYKELTRYPEALADYHQAIKLNPDSPENHYNLGILYYLMRNFSEALIHYGKAIKLNPHYADAYQNLGVTLQDLQRYDEAERAYRLAISLQPDYPEAFNNLGGIFKKQGHYAKAMAAFKQVLILRPDYAFLHGLAIHTQMHLCQWQGLAAQISSLTQRITNYEKVTPPFPLLTLIDDPALQLTAAQTFNADKFPSTNVLGELVTHPTHGKVRIGYFSADFHNHATAYLMAELFEATDSSRFEVYGFSFGPNKQDEMRQRIANTFHSFIDVANYSDHQVAAMSRKLGIDIAVDLKGYTKDSRTGIFAARCAPIQVSYLGYPGTMGAPYIDYLIADKTLIPEESKCHYSEKIVYMPHSYQANDSKRRISNRIFTRAELGLPELGFVFCCFNNSYKIMPQTFDSWMRILKAVNGSTLWLLHDNPQTAENLKQQAQRRGVEPERLIFAPRMPLPEHLARHRVADLFLDTLPCNAHTTASDALWAGLPVLTLAGESFAARVAASLVNAVDLPELVTTNQDQYEALAVGLANDPKKLTHLKQTLAKKLTTSSLFDGKRFAKNLGEAYQRMYDIHLSGQKPAHICVREEDIDT